MVEKEEFTGSMDSDPVSEFIVHSKATLGTKIKCCFYRPNENRDNPAHSIRLKMDLSGKAEGTERAWAKICETYPVPKALYRHQVDTISLLLSGEHVFVGSPTGSGKTLAQLATVLFTSGKV